MKILDQINLAAVDIKTTIKTADMFYGQALLDMDRLRHSTGDLVKFREAAVSLAAKTLRFIQDRPLAITKTAKQPDIDRVIADKLTWYRANTAVSARAVSSVDMLGTVGLSWSGVEKSLAAKNTGIPDLLVDFIFTIVRTAEDIKLADAKGK